MTSFQSYGDVRKYMDQLGLFSMDLGLGRMESFWAGHSAPVFPIVHVVGTNGKGSTSTFFESIARKHGLRTGLFTSPHLVTPRERITVNGHMLSHDDWLRLANRVLETPGGNSLTYFEFQTCLAMCAFMDKQVDVAVMEAGLGGRYDATTVLTPHLTLFTPIGMDHESVLGSTIEAIATDKAGAMHEGGVAVTGPQLPEAMRILKSRAGELGVELHDSEEVADEVTGPLGLHGTHQQDNARLAVAAWQLFSDMSGIVSHDCHVQQGLEVAFIPGRFHRVHPDGLPPLILDGAHNVPALEMLVHVLAREDVKPKAMIFNCMADKELDGMLPLLCGLTDGPILCPGMNFERAAMPEEGAARLGERAVPVAGMQEALERVRTLDGPILVCGSLYLLASFYEIYPEFLLLREK